MMTLFVDLIAVILTLIVLSRVFGDNPLFRAAQYLFVGVSLGYAFVVVYHQVLRPSVMQMISGLDQPLLIILHIVPFLLGLMFLPRISGRQRLSWLANIPLSVVFGVGAAVALSGALVGTLVPQVLATINISLQGSGAQIAGTIVLTLGVILVLSSFYFTKPQKSGLLQLSIVSSNIGRWLLMITFGFFFAGALMTYLTALSDRFEFMITFFKGVFGQFI